MTSTNHVGILWRKSSYSPQGGPECVEVSHDLTAVRDSKNPAGPALAVDVKRLIEALKNS